MPPKQPLTFNIFARLDHPWWLRSLLVAVLLLGLWIGMDFRGNAPTAIAIGGRVMVAAETLSFSTKGPIMVDGRMVFKVGSIDGFSAEVRASNANRKIQQLLDRQSPTQPADVTIQQQGELTTIRLNGQHLLTVTGGDYMAGVSPQEHARDWQQQLQMALQQAKVERTPAYQRRIAVIFVAALGGAIGLNLTLRWLRSRLLQRMLSGNFAHETPQRKRSPYYFLKIGQWCLWAIAGFYLTGLLPQTRTWRYQITNFVQAVLQNPLFQLGNTVYSLFDILKLLGLAVGLWLMVRVLTALLKSRILNKIGVEKEVQDITLLSAQILITGIGCVIILQALGIDARSLAILLSGIARSRGGLWFTNYCQQLYQRHYSLTRAAD